MLKAHQILAKSSPEFADELITWLHTDQRDAYRTILQKVAVARRLRPIFLQQKPKTEQFSWIIKSFNLIQTTELADNVVHIWLLKKHPDMLKKFLSSMDIDHDEDGSIENDLPKDLDTKKFDASLETLFKDFPEQAVVTYIHMFNLQQPDGWSAINAAILSDSRLNFGEDLSEHLPDSQKPTLEKPKKSTKTPESTPEKKPTTKKAASKKAATKKASPAKKKTNKKAATKKTTTKKTAAKKTAKS